jgi:hypothetical protein
MLRLSLLRRQRIRLSMFRRRQPQRQDLSSREIRHLL